MPEGPREISGSAATHEDNKKNDASKLWAPLRGGTDGQNLDASCFPYHVFAGKQGERRRILPRKHTAISASSGVAWDSKATAVAAGNVTGTDCTMIWTTKPFTVELWGIPSLTEAGYSLSLRR